MTKFKIKNKTTKRGGVRLVGRFSRALGAFSRNARNPFRQPFTTCKIAPMSSISVMEFGKKKQQPIAYNDTIHIDDGVRSKIDIGTTIKVVTGTLIAAFLSTLFATSIIGAEAKNYIDNLVKETTNAIYKYMVNHTCEIMQEGDTTIIASIYKTIGRHLTLDERKEIFKHLVIDDVSYEWLAEYDAIIEIWLNKVIEIKDGVLPSDKYITNIINIIQNKVLPVTNGIWYSKRAIRRATGLGLTKADIVPDSYWYTLAGKHETANGVRQTIAINTKLAKIIVGLLTAIEWYNNTKPVTNIKRMLNKIVIKFKADIIANRSSVDSELLRKPGALYPFKTISGNASSTSNSTTNAKIRELNEEVKKLEKINQLPQPPHFPQWNPKINLKPNDTVMASDIANQMQNMGAFDPYKGGVRRGSTRKQRANKYNIKMYYGI
jgi:hypothetical protein